MLRGRQLLSVLAIAALALAACAQPPERNPPPAFQAPVTITVSLPDGPDRDLLLDVARVAQRRLNRSRAPGQRPVHVTLASGAIAASASGVRVVPPASPPPGERLLDPLLPPDAVATDADLERSLGLYDSVIVVGLAARQPEPAAAWLRAQPGWGLGLGRVDFRAGDAATTGLRLETP